MPTPTEIILVFTDSSLLAMLFSALLTVLYGSMRASLFEKEAMQNPLLQEAVQSLDLKTAILFPIVASIALITLFYFMGSLYYVLLVLVSLYSVYGIYFALKPMQDWYMSKFMSETKRIINLYFVHLGVHDMILLIASCIAVLTWIKTEYWMLNNLIGFGLCVSYMSFLRLPNIKIAVLLLVGLFFYDIFWVFYSKPLFGENVM
jgi:minor histocompatibility antigen H13